MDSSNMNSKKQKGKVADDMEPDNKDKDDKVYNCMICGNIFNNNNELTNHKTCQHILIYVSFHLFMHFLIN